MDKELNPKKRWDWLPVQMPRVAALMKEKRRELGDAHVNECWKRGVVGMEPGWFFAREGALAVGAPWADDSVMANFAAGPLAAGQAVLCINVGKGRHGDV
jgi:hypothetical protein